MPIRAAATRIVGARLNVPTAGSGHARGAFDSATDLFKAMDGVTTALELEIETADVDGWYAARQGRAVINDWGRTLTWRYSIRLPCRIG
jgi:hypothetical protein